MCTGTSHCCDVLSKGDLARRLAQNAPGCREHGSCFLSHLMPLFCGTCTCFFPAMRSCPPAPSGTWHEGSSKAGNQQCWPDGKSLQRPQQEGGCRHWGGPSQHGPFYGWSSASYESPDTVPDCPGLVPRCNSAQGSPFVCKSLKQT